MRYLFITMLILAGCQSKKDTTDDGTAAAVGRAQSSVVLSFCALGDGDEVPSPPIPSPSAVCERCNGTGTIKPDGRISLTCPDCDGTGKTTQTGTAASSGIWYNVDKIDEIVHKSIRWEDAPPDNPDKPVLFYFTAKYCKNCKVLDRDVYTDQKVIDAISNETHPVKVDITGKKTPKGITAVPALVLEYNGKPRIVWDANSPRITKNSILSWLYKALAKVR
tara:strand:+ start:4072 stop:4734 length:663 start_codon:yes stop_codon:yes gene_type:complete